MSGTLGTDGPGAAEPDLGVPLRAPSVDDAAARSGPIDPTVDRAAALAEGAPGVPTNFIFWVLGVVLVLSLGGLLGEHLFSSSGLNPTPTTVPAAPAAPAGAPVPPTPRAVSAPLPAFMGLSTPHPRRAPAFTLPDQTGAPTGVPAQPPRVVVLTFFDASCNDICPVLASELALADRDLGADANRVEFVTVNTDPSAVAQPAAAPSLQSAVAALPNWHLVTGSLATLNSIWKSYGISISVDTKTGLEAHNEVMDFIDTHGDLRYRATPFADESPTGNFTSPAATMARWGQGIATYAQRLLGR
jgi:cytochrome oxidase Cu insertion factor (SCO1/SenC/PrrC family)